MKYHSPQRRSAVLILALLLMGAIIGSSIAISTVISESNHQTGTLNDFIGASLAADSGLERSLAVLKLGRLNQTLDTTKAAIPHSQEGTVVTVSDANTNNSSVSVARLRPAESYSLDIIPAPNTLDTLKVTVSCITASACRNTKYTVSWIGLNASLSPIYTGQTTIAPFNLNTPLVVPQTVANEIHLHDNIYTVTPTSGDITQPSDSTARGYRIRVTATTPSSAINLSADDLALKNIVIKSCHAQSGPVGCSDVDSAFRSRLQITSTGTENASRAVKTVTVPWQPSASGVFNYVIFSEGAIDKLID